MLGSISPVGESSRQQRWWLTATAYTVASLLGGAAIGIVLGAAGAGFTAMTGWSSTTRLVLLAAVALLGAATDARLLPWSLPTWHRQVDERWLTEYRGWVYGLGFGFQLGTGVATIVTAAVTYTALAAAFLTGSWRAGLAVGLVFGAVRSAPLLLAGVVRTADRLHRVTRRVAEAEPTAQRVVVVGQLAAGGVALASAVLVRL